MELEEIRQREREREQKPTYGRKISSLHDYVLNPAFYNSESVTDDKWQKIIY